MPAVRSGGLSRRDMLAATAGALAEAVLLKCSSADAQPPEEAHALGRATLGPVLSQPGWSKWIEAGEIAPLYQGEIALLKSITGTAVFDAAAEASARQIVARARMLRPDAEAAYVSAFLTFAGLQHTQVFRQWHEATYVKHAGRSAHPSGDDPYIWGKNQIPASAAWANVEIGYAVERLGLSGMSIHSFSKDTGGRTPDSVLEDYLFAHYRVVCSRLDGNEKNPAEGTRLAQIMFARKDITGFLNVLSRGYTHPSDNALMHSTIANKDVSLCKYVTDFEPDFKILLYGIGKELDTWVARSYRKQDVAWGLMSGVRPLSRTSVRAGNLSGNPRNSTHARGVAADVILAGPGAYQVVEAGRKAWSEALWKTALSGLAAKYGLRHLGPSIDDWPHIDIDPMKGLRESGVAQLRRWRQTIAREAASRPSAQSPPQLLQEPRGVRPPRKQ
jgi:hypothetical protein